MLDSDNNDYTKLYIRRQEQIILEQIKRGIDAEAKFAMISSLTEEIQKEHEETKRQLEVQIDIANQAANALQSMVQTNKNLESELENLKTKHENLNLQIVEKDRAIGELIVQKDNISNNLNSCVKKTDDLERELLRQQKEMQDIYEENKELKAKKTINKKKSIEENDSDF